MDTATGPGLGREHLGCRLSITYPISSSLLPLTSASWDGFWNTVPKLSHSSVLKPFPSKSEGSGAFSVPGFTAQHHAPGPSLRTLFSILACSSISRAGPRFPRTPCVQGLSAHGDRNMYTCTLGLTGSGTALNIHCGPCAPMGCKIGFRSHAECTLFFLIQRLGGHEYKSTVQTQQDTPPA